MQHPTEIERQFLIKDVNQLPFDISAYPYKDFIQGYLNYKPTIRIRKEGEEYFLTYKAKQGDSVLSRTEYNLPLDKESFQNLLPKCEGKLIYKRRYFIPYENHLLELDIFQADLEGLIYLEVEFKDEESAFAFQAPDFFGEEITGKKGYSNADLSKR